MKSRRPSELSAVPDDRDAALLAYRRGDEDAADRLATALASAPLDGGLLIADATLAQERGRPGALDRLRHMLRSAPDWLDGHVALAHLLWGAGDRSAFLAQMEQALALLPRHAGLWMRYMDLLADSGAPLQAADVAARLRRSGGDAPALRLIEVRHAGAAGALDRADRLIDSLPPDMPGLAAEAARQRLRRGDPAAATPLLDDARAVAPDDCSLWALSELAWRATGDPRHRWLLDESHFGPTQIDLDRREMEALTVCLRALHGARWPPLGQSVRAGTQTRGDLQDRAETPLVALFHRLSAAVRDHVARLPPRDDGHPLLRHRDARLSIASAWSIRIDGSGHHVSHIHPGGILSSAFYAEVPATLDHARQEGWLELGRPPRDIALPLDPLVRIAPSPGRLVLFPSYLYHGTLPFSGGERLTVAFDVGAAS